MLIKSPCRNKEIVACPKPEVKTTPTLAVVDTGDAIANKADFTSFFDRADFEPEDFAAAFSDFFAITICFSFQCLPAGNLPLQVSFRKLSRRLTF